jgi:hypothetical protein
MILLSRYSGKYKRRKEKMTYKRLVICTILGLIAGLLCFLGGKYAAGVTFTTFMALAIIANRGFIGFAIGISRWRIPWFLHGIIVGFLGTLPAALPALDAPGAAKGFIMFLIFGGVWGFLIELFALLFGAKMK